MSKNLTNAAVIEFDSEVKHEYQGMKTLRECVTQRTGVKGESYKFTRMGKGLANQKASQADVTPMDISHSRQTATMQNWNAPEYTDIFDQAEVNFDEKSELAQTIAKAIGRREDQLIIDTLAGGTQGGGEGFTFATINDQNANTGFSATVATNLTVKELRTASKHLNDIEADDSDRFCLTNAQGLDALLATTQITSSDYNSVKALVQGEVDTFMGFKFKKVGTRTEGGMPGSTGASQAFMWHKASIGIAIGIDLKTTIDWVAQKTGWLANGIFKAGATAREPQGIVRIIYDETA
jgi:hypothetical protein